MRYGWRLSQFGFLFLIAAVLLPLEVFAQDNSQGVRSVSIDASLQPDGSLLVTENLRYDFGDVPQTGFVRRLVAPANGQTKVSSVLRDGLEDEFKTTRAGNITRVITGSEDIEITGQQDYEISYTIDDTLVQGNNKAQLVWRVVDNAGISAGGISINLTSSLELERVSCRLTPNQEGCPVSKTDEGYQAHVDELPAGQSLTIQVDMPADQLSYDPPALNTDRNALPWLLISGIILAGLCFGIYWWIRQEKDPDQAPVSEHIDSLS
jgi:hypothetical protein